MAKLIAVLSIIGLAILDIGSLVAPNSPAMWLASVKPSYVIIRLIIAAVLLALLTTDIADFRLPRDILGGLAAILAVWGLSTIFASNVMFLDSISLVSASIAMTVMLIEQSSYNNSLSEEDQTEVIGRLHLPARLR